MAPTLDDVQVEQPAPGTSVVVFSGEHDLATRDEVRELLDSLVRWDHLLVADFSAAYFVDASILGVLLETDERARALGKTFRLQLGTATIVRRAFEICGLTVPVQLTVAEYEAVRADATHFLVAPGEVHTADIERVVKREERYWIVEKRGRAAEVSETFDPRS